MKEREKPRGGERERERDRDRDRDRERKQEREREAREREREREKAREREKKKSAPERESERFSIWTHVLNGLACTSNKCDKLSNKKNVSHKRPRRNYGPQLQCCLGCTDVPQKCSMPLRDTHTDWKLWHVYHGRLYVQRKLLQNNVRWCMMTVLNKCHKLLKNCWRGGGQFISVYRSDFWFFFFIVVPTTKTIVTPRRTEHWPSPFKRISCSFSSRCKGLGKFIGMVMPPSLSP